MRVRCVLKVQYVLQVNTRGLQKANEGDEIRDSGKRGKVEILLNRCPFPTPSALAGGEEEIIAAKNSLSKEGSSTGEEGNKNHSHMLTE